MERSKKILLESMGAVGAGTIFSVAGHPEIGIWFLPAGGFNALRVLIPPQEKKKLKKVI
jgi:hypothetical protein